MHLTTDKKSIIFFSQHDTMQCNTHFYSPSPPLKLSA